MKFLKGDGKIVQQRKKKPVAPYMAVGLSTVVHGISQRSQIARNLSIIEEAIHASVSIVNINMPVKVVALAEGSLTGFTDEIFDLPHVVAARELFIDIPGEETERLGKLAKQYGIYIYDTDYIIILVFVNRKTRKTGF